LRYSALKAILKPQVSKVFILRAAKDLVLSAEIFHFVQDDSKRGFENKF
jgi:hypothetical protein